MSKKYKPAGRGDGLCKVVAALMAGEHTRNGLALDLDADPDAIGHALELLHRNGLAYRSRLDKIRTPLANGNLPRGKYPVCWAWNPTPFAYTDFRGPNAATTGERNAT